MFVGGIGSHLKVSQVDQSVCLGNELNNLSAIKRFFQIIAPYATCICLKFSHHMAPLALGRTLATDVSDTDTSTFFGTIFFWHCLRYQYWHQTKWKIPRISRDQDVILYAHWEASLPPEKMIFWKTSKTNLDQPPLPPQKKIILHIFFPKMLNCPWCKCSRDCSPIQC